MRRFRISYTLTAREVIQHLPPLIKPTIKALIEKIADDPEIGKPLRYELSGYMSARFQRWRVIYVVRKKERVVEIHLVERRKSVYETLKEMSH